MYRKSFEREELVGALVGSVRLRDVYENLGYTRDCNGKVQRQIKGAFQEFGIDLKGELAKNRVKILVCPVCSTEFEVPRYLDQVTCSYGCANSHFRSGEDHPNWSEDYYRTTCFVHHDKECVVCGEDLIVEVHHLDHDRSNNGPDNLIPMCPTHHQYWHSRYRHLVEEQVLSYLRGWQSSRIG